jgi:hypothetical protein
VRRGQTFINVGYGEWKTGVLRQHRTSISHPRHHSKGSRSRIELLAGFSFRM